MTDDLLDLMKRSGCIGIFFGIESFGAESLRDAHKPQNKISTYKARIRELHDRGICVMAGFIAGFDGDTPESITAMARQLYETGVDVPFLSVLTPYRGTPAYSRLAEEGRILHGRGWEFYNGYNVSFQPRGMSPEQLLDAHRALWREAFSLKYSVLRVVRSLGRLRFGAFLMCLVMNALLLPETSPRQRAHRVRSVRRSRRNLVLRLLALLNISDHRSKAYSALVRFRRGISESASFQRVKKSWYAARAFIRSPADASARPSCKRATARTGSVKTMPAWSSIF